MSISSTVRKAGPFSCNGATVQFPFVFKVFAAADLRVVLTSPTGVLTDLVLTSHYTVSLNADQDNSPGGTVTTLTAYPTGYGITITSAIASLQPVVLTNQGGFYPDVLNTEFDRLTILVQQLAEQFSRCVSVDFGSTQTPAQLTAAIFAAETNSAASASSAASSASQANVYASSVTGSVAQLASATRNRIINGGGQVQQRGPMALSASSNTSYCCDRWTVCAAGGTGLSGNADIATSAGATRSNYLFGAVNASWTNATMQVRSRLDDGLVASLNSKTVTLSGKVYQNLGSTRTVQVSLSKANTLNNFSATTGLGSTTVSVPSGTATSFSYTLTLGSSDATNGLLVSIEDTATSTASSKTFAVGDVQLEEGPSATVYEVRLPGLELALCQRYYEQSYAQGTAPGTVTATGICSMQVSTAVAGNIYAGVRHKIEKRATPTVTLYSQNGLTTQSTNGAGVDLSANSATVTGACTAGFNISNTRGSDITPTGNVILWHYTSSAEL